MPYFADKGNDIKQINCSYDIWNATAILLIVEALHPSFTSDFISCWINNEFFGANEIDPSIQDVVIGVVRQFLET